MTDTTQTLLKLVEDIAREHYDGHLTVLRFTTHWKVCFGTIDLLPGDNVGRLEVQALPAFKTLDEALERLLIDRYEVPEVNARGPAMVRFRDVGTGKVQWGRAPSFRYRERVDGSTGDVTVDRVWHLVLDRSMEAVLNTKWEVTLQRGDRVVWKFTGVVEDYTENDAATTYQMVERMEERGRPLAWFDLRKKK